MIDSFRIVKRIYKEFLHKHIHKICLSLFLMVVVAVTTTANAYMMKPVIDRVFIKKKVLWLGIASITILGLFIVKCFASYFSRIILSYIESSVVKDIQTKLYQKILNFDISAFHENSSGKFISHFSNDINAVKSSLTGAFVAVFREFFTLIFLVGLMFAQNFSLAVVSLFVFPVTIFPIIKISRRLRKIAKSTQGLQEKFISKLDDSFEGVKIVKSYNAQDYELSRFTKLANEIFFLNYKNGKTSSISSPLMEFVGGIAVVLVILYGGIQVMNGSSTPGRLFSFIAAFLMAYKPMRSLSGLNNTVQTAIVGAEKIFSVIDMPNKIIETKAPEVMSKDIEKISFNNISFSYGEAGKMALEDLSIEIKKGQKVGIVGRSGSGKSTVANLLLRFYDVSSGNIEINGSDIRNFTIEDLREEMSIVSQDVFLFEDNMRNNICYGRTDVSEEKMVEAAKLAFAHDFIMSLPEKYSTQLGQNGARLSGGQRQRISIARAIVKNSPILILDEATSSLDTITEKEVSLALDNLMQNRTTIIISHNLYSTRNCNIIYLLEHGRVIDVGTHNELVSRNTLYMELYEKYD